MTAGPGFFSRANATLAYLVAVLLLGGASAAAFSANTMLQMLGAVLIGWTLWSGSGPLQTRTGLRRFGITMAVLALVQFVPLPPALWSALPGRDTVAQGFTMLDVTPPWRGLSLAPWKSLAALAWWIPALALFCAARSEGGPPVRHLVMTIALFAGLSVLLGTMQRIAGSGYLYLVTNYGEGPGFFANSNHQGSFLLCALALWGGYVVSEMRQDRRRKWRSSTPMLQLGLGALLAFGVLVSGSLACVVLLVPVVVTLALLARPDWRLPLPVVIGLGVVVMAGMVTFLILGPVANDLTAKSATAGISRQEFLFTGARILRDFAPFGTGLGTFQDIYRWYEDTTNVGTTYVNHAHDDLLELLIETGVFGFAAVAMFLAWFVPRALGLWRGDRSHAIALAASTVIGVELLHSLVDYPLRTAAMSSIVALACVLLVRAPEALRSKGGRRRNDDPAAPRQLVRI